MRIFGLHLFEKPPLRNQLFVTKCGIWIPAVGAIQKRLENGLSGLSYARGVSFEVMKQMVAGATAKKEKIPYSDEAIVHVGIRHLAAQLQDYADKLIRCMNLARTYAKNQDSAAKKALDSAMAVFQLTLQQVNAKTLEEMENEILALAIRAPGNVLSAQATMKKHLAALQGILLQLEGIYTRFEGQLHQLELQPERR